MCFFINCASTYHILGNCLMTETQTSQYYDKALPNKNREAAFALLRKISNCPSDGLWQYNPVPTHTEVPSDP